MLSIKKKTLYESESMHSQKMKFFITDFFSKSAQICRKLRIWSYLLKKSLMENFIFCAVLVAKTVYFTVKRCYKMQWKAFERSANIASLILPLSRHTHHFSVITRRYCCVLKESTLRSPLRVYDWSIYTLDRRSTFHISSANYARCLLDDSFKLNQMLNYWSFEKKKSEKISTLSFIVFSGTAILW